MSAHNNSLWSLDAPNGEHGSAIHVSHAGNVAHEAQHRMVVFSDPNCAVHKGQSHSATLFAHLQHSLLSFQAALHSDQMAAMLCSRKKESP